MQAHTRHTCEVRPANLDIVLVSSIWNPPADVLTDLPDSNEHIEHSDSDHESDPAGDTAGSERDAPDDTLRREAETDTRGQHVPSRCGIGGLSARRGSHWRG